MGAKIFLRNVDPARERSSGTSRRMLVELQRDAQIGGVLARA